MSHPRLRGGDAALDAIGELIASVRIRASAVLVLEGGPGTGKTRLLEEAAMIATRAGVAVARGTAVPGNRVVPMAPLREALVATPAAAALGSAGDPLLDNPAGLLQGLRRALALAAQDGPVVLCLDDVQWADRGTVAALSTMPDLLTDLPVGLVLAADLSRLVLDIRGVRPALERAGSWTTLRPLADDAIAAVVRDVLGGAPDSRLLAVAGHADGNPAELLEVLRGLQEDGQVEVVDGAARLRTSSAPERIRSRLQKRLATLSPAGRQVAGIIAVFDGRGSAPHVATMLAPGAPGVAAAVRELQDAQLVLAASDGRLRTRDELVREVVLAALPPSGLAALRRQAAEVLLEAGARPIEVAGLLAAGARPLDVVAARTLDEAARTLAAKEPARGAELALRGMELVERDDAVWGELAVVAITLLHAAGRTTEARDRAARWIDETEDVELQGELLLQVAELRALDADVRAAADRRALGLRGLSASGQAMHRARLVANLADAGRLAEAKAALVSADDALARDDVRRATAILAEARVTLDLAAGRYTEVVADTTRLGVGPDAALGAAVPEALALTRVQGLLALGDLTAALADVEAGLRSARGRGRWWAAGAWADLRVRVLVALGRLDEVLSGPVLTPGTVETTSQAAALAAVAHAALSAGAVDHLRSCETAAELVLGQATPGVAAWATDVLLRTADARGDAGDVRRLLASVTMSLPARGDPVALVRLAMRVGEDAFAERTAVVAGVCARENPASRHLAGLAAHAEGLLLEQSDALEHASLLFEGSPARLARASLLEDLGRLGLRCAGTRVPAINRLDAALADYEACGARSDAARVRRRLRRAAEHRRPVARARSDADGRLTDAERRVVELVAAGLSNREVAERLYLSPNTVGTHLRRAFRKLGVTSRRELVLGAVARRAQDRTMR